MPHDYIAEALRGFAVPIDSLTPDPKNARKHDERNIESIRQSLIKFGQRLPIIVQRQGMIVRAGNGRMQAAQKLGWTHIAAIVVDEADAEAAAFAIADNRTAELAEWDWGQLAQTLAELRVELPDFNVELMGWSEREIAGLELATAWDNLEDGEGAHAGDRKRVDGNTLVLKFTQEQSQRIHAVLQRLALCGPTVETVTTAGVVEALNRC